MVVFPSAVGYEVTHSGSETSRSLRCSGQGRECCLFYLHRSSENLGCDVKTKHYC